MTGQGPSPWADRDAPWWVKLRRAGVLQINNDLVDEVDYLNCPNCGQVFARQVGGSEFTTRAVLA